MEAPSVREVLELVGSCLSNGRIAERRHISVRTVESYVASLIRKLEVADRHELVTYAAEHNVAVSVPAAWARHNLPVSRLLFVGREAELEQLERERVVAREPLVTRREPLGVDGGRVFRDPSLDIETEAVALFVERALSARPGLVLDSPSQTTITEMCRRLDGIPLAIELAVIRALRGRYDFCSRVAVRMAGYWFSFVRLSAMMTWGRELEAGLPADDPDHRAMALLVRSEASWQAGEWEEFNACGAQTSEVAAEGAALSTKKALDAELSASGGEP